MEINKIQSKSKRRSKYITSIIKIIKNLTQVAKSNSTEIVSIKPETLSVPVETILETSRDIIDRTPATKVDSEPLPIYILEQNGIWNHFKFNKKFKEILEKINKKEIIDYFEKNIKEISEHFKKIKNEFKKSKKQEKNNEYINTILLDLEKNLLPTKKIKKSNLSSTAKPFKFLNTTTSSNIKSYKTHQIHFVSIFNHYKSERYQFCSIFNNVIVNKEIISSNLHNLQLKFEYYKHLCAVLLAVSVNSGVNIKIKGGFVRDLFHRDVYKFVDIGDIDIDFNFIGNQINFQNIVLKSVISKALQIFAHMCQFKIILKRGGDNRILKIILQNKQFVLNVEIININAFKKGTKIIPNFDVNTLFITTEKSLLKFNSTLNFDEVVNNIKKSTIFQKKLLSVMNVFKMFVKKFQIIGFDKKLYIKIPTQSYLDLLKTMKLNGNFIEYESLSFVLPYLKSDDELFKLTSYGKDIIGRRDDFEINFSYLDYILKIIIKNTNDRTLIDIINKKITVNMNFLRQNPGLQ